jgi:hypothetical protein
MRSTLGLAFIVFCAALSGAQRVSTASAAREYPAPLIREEQTVMVNGVAETWRLQWSARPHTSCGSDDEGAFTCPCMGFAYGESGHLSLVRLRGGKEIERISLDRFFNESPAAEQHESTLQRWPVDAADADAFEKRSIAVDVAKRPPVHIMNFADYDHDGNATEFLMQVGAVPCGKRIDMLVGVSRSDPHLHVFGTASHPRKPLFLQQREWQALRQSSSAVRVVDWACEDHGAETEADVVLRATARGIDGERLEYTCPPNARRLLKKSALDADQ